MMRLNWLAAAFLVFIITRELPAQVVVSPNTIFVYGNTVVFGGPHSHRRTVPGFYTTVGYQMTYWLPAVPLYVTPIRLISPVIVVRAPPLYPTRDVDLRGVDLDVVGPDALHPGANPAKVPVPPVDAKPPEKTEPRKPDMPAKPPEAPKKEAAAPPKPPPPKPDKPPNLDEPRAEPLEESRRLTELGLSAFRAQEYNLAARRFDQAAEVAPAQPYPFFLLAQAYLALRKYKQAVRAIERGMTRQEDWPLSQFQPRDLYQGIEDQWLAHKKQLSDTQALHPSDPTYLFLKAYEWWFDGQRQEAAAMFERARVLAPGNPFIAAFLRVWLKVANAGW